MRLDSFNDEPAAALTATLLACCDVPSWASAVERGRPYASHETLYAVADSAARGFTRAEVQRALAAHPRIGERAVGEGRQADWSRGEQSGVAQDEQTRAALAVANRAYEERFDQVFLVCASGLSEGEVMAHLQRRLGNDEETEARVVADELRKIALLRLRKVLEP